MSKRRRNKISGQFSAHLVEMLESPAHRTLSLSARRVLDRIEIEHAHHGGTDNGRLPVTFNQFHEYGIHRHSIAPGIREAEALGFVETTVRGRAGNAEHRAASLFRLTYRNADGLPGDGTHEWRKIATAGEAETIAAAARNYKRPKKTKSQCRKTPVTGAGNHHRKPKLPVPETITTEVAKTITTSISRADIEQACEARHHGAVASKPAELARTVDRLDLVHDRIAKLFGSGGWDLVARLSADDLDSLVALDVTGKLTLAAIETVRFNYRRGVA